jgi:hypothetical protein
MHISLAVKNELGWTVSGLFQARHLCYSISEEPGEREAQVAEWTVCPTVGAQTLNFDFMWVEEGGIA